MENSTLCILNKHESNFYILLTKHDSEWFTIGKNIKYNDSELFKHIKEEFKNNNGHELPIIRGLSYFINVQLSTKIYYGMIDKLNLRYIESSEFEKIGWFKLSDIIDNKIDHHFKLNRTVAEILAKLNETLVKY